MCNKVHRCFLLHHFLLFAAIAAGAEPHIDLHIFWSKECPHCEKALVFLSPLPDSYPGLVIHRHELGDDPRNLEMLISLAKQHQITDMGVPFIVLGDQVLIGSQDDASTGAELKKRIEACLQKGARLS